MMRSGRWWFAGYRRSSERLPANLRPLMRGEVGRCDEIRELHQCFFRSEECRLIECRGIGRADLRRQRGGDLLGRRQAAVVVSLRQGGEMGLDAGQLVGERARIVGGSSTTRSITGARDATMT